MAGASKTFKKATSLKTLKKRALPTDLNKMKDSFINPMTVLEEGAEDLGGLFTPDIPEPEEQTIIPIPNEALAATKARKRRARAKTSGRSSTILTEGLGG